MKYDLLIFDADETLFDFKKAERHALKKAMKSLGLPYKEDLHLPQYKAINTKIWQELEAGLLTQKKLKVERFRRFLKVLNCDIEAKTLAKAYMIYLSKGSFLFKDSMSLIQSLHDQYEMMIITNGLTAVQDNRIRKSTIAEYFKKIVISEEIGIPKPNPEIFKKALEYKGVYDKTSILMIGDSLRSDIQGGINFGIDTCWYNPNSLKNTEDFKPTYEVQSLMEIIDILK